MKRVVRANSDYRTHYIDLIERIRHDVDLDLMDEINDILLSYGASEDDSDREEGLYVTMADIAIRDAYDNILELVKKQDVAGNEFSKPETLLIDAGFKKQYVDSSEGSVEYFVKGNVGVVVTSPEEARALAKKLL